MTQEQMQIVLQLAESQVSSQEGHARELLASAQNQKMLIAALREEMKENEKLRQQQPKTNNHYMTFNGPVGQAIGNVNTLNANKTN